MTTTTPNPPGWYVDPTGHHEHRYWDGKDWTAAVADAGVTATDEPQASPGAPVPYGYRAVAVATWRVAALYVVLLGSLGAFVLEVIASSNLQSSPADLGRWAWLYREAPGVLLYGYPPLGLWLGLLLTAVLTSALLLPPGQALKKAGLRVRWGWSAAAERVQLSKDLRGMGFTFTLLRGRGGRVLLVLSELAALLVVTVSGYALLAHRGVLDETRSGPRTSVGDLQAGLGPKVCLVVGVLSAVLLLLAWPWRARKHVLVLRDGTVRAEPLT